MPEEPKSKKSSRTVEEIVANIKRLGAEAEELRKRAIEIERKREEMLSVLVRVRHPAK